MTKIKNIDNFYEFMENYYLERDYKSSDHPKKRVDFFPFQKDIIEKIETNPITLVLKSRQMFMTTLMCYYCAYKIIRNENIDNMEPTRIYLRSFCSNSRKMMLSKIKEIIKNVDCDTLNKATKNNVNELYISEYTFIKSIGSTCGINPSLIIFDEAAYCHDFEGVFKSGGFINGKMIAYSSNNKSNYFFLDKINSDDKGFEKIKLHYSQNPIHTKESIDGLKKLFGDYFFDVEMEMLKIKETPKEKINKDELITARITKELKNKMESKLYNLSEQKGELIKVSDYIRGLIERDLGLIPDCSPNQ